MGKICYSLKDVDSLYCQFMAETRDEDAVEVRLDECELDNDEIKEIFSIKRNSILIATYRCEEDEDTKEAVEALSMAILSGTDFIDLDIDFEEKSQDWLIKLAMNKGCKIILSYHNYFETESLNILKKIADKCIHKGADIVKIITTAHEKKDADRVLSLYKYYDSNKLIAFAMGEIGQFSRISSFKAGAPFIYITPFRGGETAPGQYTFYDFVYPEEKILSGKVYIPASKSFTQRFIIAATLSEGQSELSCIESCDDINSALSVSKQLGAKVEYDNISLKITGNYDFPENIFVGESGLLARLCIPLAGLSKNDVTISGEKSLMGRDLNQNSDTLKKLGIEVKYTNVTHLPAIVSGQIHGGDIEISGEGGSQLISGLLMTLPLCPENSTIKVENATSVPYIELTINILKDFGIVIDYTSSEDKRTLNLSIKGGQKPKSAFLISERDWSSASFFMVAGALLGDVELPDMNVDSFQADAAIYDVLDQCGADILHDETYGDISVRKSIICPFDFDITNTPDLFPPLLLLALRADGESTIRGLNRLKNKESNRAVTFYEEFKKLGAQININGDVMTIHGNYSFKLNGGKVSSHGDHRLAMALSIAALLSDDIVEIDDIECINKSFPTFKKLLNSLQKKI